MQKLEHGVGVAFDHIAISEFVRVADASKSDVVREAVSCIEEAAAEGVAKVVTAIHIGGLNEIQAPGYAAALGRSRLVYADGIAVVLLARLMGATSVQRAATTDIGIPILLAAAERLDRPVRVALVGGAEGLAEAAVPALSNAGPIEVVFTCHGYQEPDEWVGRLAELSDSQPDVVFVGLGSPRELVFCEVNINRLPPALILTCGGWFGFLAGTEPRAPRFMRWAGLEWANRLAHDPGRLAARYAKGVVTFVSLAAQGAAGRLGSS